MNKAKHTTSLKNIHVNHLKESLLRQSSIEYPKLFQTTFKKEDCFTIKARLAKIDPVTDPFIDDKNKGLRNLAAPYDKKNFCVIIKIIIATFQMSPSI